MSSGSHRWRRHGRSRRAIGFLEPTLLLLLHHGPAHGYTLLDELDRFGLRSIDRSAVYRALRDMETRGWITSSWEEEETRGPPRRIYRLGALGDEVLAWWTKDLEETRRLVDHFLEAYNKHMEEGDGEYHIDSRRKNAYG